MKIILISTFILSISAASGCSSNDLNNKGHSNNKNKIVEVFDAVKITDGNHTFSEESIFKVNKTIYSLRTKAIYDKSGTIEKLILYKPEGILEYNKEHLLKDRKIMNYSGFPFSQKWSYVNGSLTDDSINYISSVTKVSDYILKSEKNKKTIFYKLKQKK